MSEAPRNPRRSIFKLLLASISVLAAVAGAELVNRIRLKAQGRAYDAAAVRSELRREDEDPDELGGYGSGLRAEFWPDEQPSRVLHPYTGFDTASLESVRSDAAYFGTAAADASFDILILGGSVAAAFGSKGSETLIERLRRDPRFADRRMRVFPYGRAAFKQPQQLISLIYLFAHGFRPDAVINLDGFNEIAIANRNTVFGAHPLQPAVNQWGPHVVGVLENERFMEGLVALRVASERTDELAGSALRSRLLWSSLAGNWWLDRVRSARGQRGRLQVHLVSELGRLSPVVEGPPWEGDLDEVMRFSVTNWREASISIDAICDRRSIFYLHVLQPTLHAAGSKEPTPSEVQSGRAPPAWMDAVRVGYPMLIEAGDELREEGVEFLDATDAFKEVTGTLYVDACHFNAEGHELLAERVAAAFLDGYERE